MSHCVLVSQDVVFEEGQPHHTSASVGEQLPVFDMDNLLTPPANTLLTPPADNGPVPDLPNVRDLPDVDQTVNNPIYKPCQSNHMSQPSQAGL